MVNNSILQERRLEKHSNNNNPKERTLIKIRSVTEDLGVVEEDPSAEEVDPSVVEEEEACMDHAAASAEAWAAVDS